MKTQKNLLAALFLACCPLFLFGQLRHEIKIAPLDLFSTFTPSYELILNEKIGVEVEMSFQSIDLNLIGGGSNFSTETFDRRRFVPGISGKYYLSSDKYGSGFYIGPHFKLIYNTSIEDTYEDAYFQRFNTNLPCSGQIGYQSFSAGLNGGYKWLIKENFIVESAFFGTLFYAKEENGVQGGRGFDFDMEIRVGYRFK